MRPIKLATLFLPAALLAGCSDGGTSFDFAGTGDLGSGDEVLLSGELSGNRSFTADKQYVLTANTYIKDGTLTIAPGTIIKGQSGTALFITTSAKIDAVGTQTQPIVFTSARPVGQRKAQDWGGLVLLGKAKINVTGGETIFEALANDERGKYGGQDDAHDCGKLKYARFEFGGFPYQQDKEFNNLTIAACGSATQIDYVQSHKGADDGIEIFGGTASIKHAVVTQNEDDGIDWDYGWRGTAQFVVIQHTPTAGNHGLEGDNNASDNAAQPQSNPSIYNLTYVGSAATTEAPKKDKELVAIFRTGTLVDLGNSVLTAARTFPVDVTNPSTVAAAKAGKVSITSSVVFGNNKQDAWDDAGTLCDTDPSAMMRKGDCAERGCVKGDEGAVCLDTALDLNEGASFMNIANANLTNDPQLADPTNVTAPSWKPAANSPVLDASKVKAAPAGLEQVSFLGAIGTDDWTLGWTAYPQN